MNGKRKEILDYIISYVNKNKYSPSYREIVDNTSLKSVSSVNMYLNDLQDLGLLTFKKGISRTIVLADGVDRNYVSKLVG